MSPAAVSRRIRRVAGLVKLDRKLFRKARFVEPPESFVVAEGAAKYGKDRQNSESEGGHS